MRNFALLAKVVTGSILILSFGIFRWQAANERSRTAMGIETILRDEYKSASSFQLSRSLTDLERLRFIHCVRLIEQTNTTRIFYDTSEKPSCSGLNSLYGLFGTELMLTAANGMQYQLQFRLPMNGEAMFLELSWYILVLVSALYFAKRNAQREAEHAITARVSKELFDQASQVAHDIRSPLAALEMVMKDAASLPEEQRLLVRSATSRIRDIANDLLSQGKAKDSSQQIETASPQLLSALIELILTEKRMQFRSRPGVEIESRIDPPSYGLFAVVPPSEFKRVISNLINNSVEAIEARGVVAVRLRRKENSILVEVEDTGKGIAPEILPHLGKEKRSYGKSGSDSGSGIGVFHARQAVESWGGKLEIRSELGNGATFTLQIPAAETPTWFPGEIVFRPNEIPVVVDDDLSILRIWEGRFRSQGIQKSLHFSSAEAFCQWLEVEGNPDRYKFLFDYELIGSSRTGLDLIDEFRLQNESILVTSRFEEQTIRERATRIGVKVLPKGLAAFVPIRSTQQSSPILDAVLLDNDPLVQELWQIAAKRRKKTLLCFTSSDELLKALTTLDPQVPCYLDSHLAEGDRKGEEVAKLLFDRGFKNLYLATGTNASSFGSLPWLRGIVGKNPPWV